MKFENGIFTWNENGANYASKNGMVKKQDSDGHWLYTDFWCLRGFSWCKTNDGKTNKSINEQWIPADWQSEIMQSQQQQAETTKEQAIHDMDDMDSNIASLGNMPTQLKGRLLYEKKVKNNTTKRTELLTCVSKSGADIIKMIMRDVIGYQIEENVTYEFCQTPAATLEHDLNMICIAHATLVISKNGRVNKVVGFGQENSVAKSYEKMVLEPYIANKAVGKALRNAYLSASPMEVYNTIARLNDGSMTWEDVRKHFTPTQAEKPEEHLKSAEEPQKKNELQKVTQKKEVLPEPPPQVTVALPSQEPPKEDDTPPQETKTAIDCCNFAYDTFPFTFTTTPDRVERQFSYLEIAMNIEKAISGADKEGKEKTSRIRTIAKHLTEKDVDRLFLAALKDMLENTESFPLEEYYFMKSDWHDKQVPFLPKGYTWKMLTEKDSIMPDGKTSQDFLQLMENSASDGKYRGLFVHLSHLWKCKNIPGYQHKFLQTPIVSVCGENVFSYEQEIEKITLNKEKFKEQKFPYTHENVTFWEMATEPKNRQTLHWIWETAEHSKLRILARACLDAVKRQKDGTWIFADEETPTNESESIHEAADKEGFLV